VHIRPMPFLIVLLTGAALAQAPVQPLEGVAANPKLKGYDANGGGGKTLYEIPIDGTIDLGLASFVERVLANAEAGDVVILKIKTFGGRVDAAVRIRDALLDSKATTVAYIDHRAISAGALIALACDTIIMSPGAAIGAATPVEMSGEETKAAGEKVVSYMRAEMRATAEAKGRKGIIAEAMVDKDIEVPGLDEKGKLLTLTGDKALEVGIAEAIAPTYDAVFVLLNLPNATRAAQETHWGEKVARALTDPVVSSLLMSFGVLGLLMEFYTGGHGIGAAIGIACLTAFFFGQYAANLAGWEEILVFGLGVILLAVEVFVIPGFGFAGILGITLMAVGFGMALVELELPLGVSFELGYLQQAIEAVAIQLAAVMLALVGGAVIFGRFLPGTRMGKTLILQSQTSAAQGYVSSPPNQSQLVGKSGRAVGPLRPAGIAELDGNRLDVVTEGDFIDAGSTIQVVQVEGMRIVVRKIG
jgi:membrane-bound serine protease (ClpP class)